MQRRLCIYSFSSSKGDTIRTQSNILYLPPKPTQSAVSENHRHMHTRCRVPARNQSPSCPSVSALSYSSRLQKVTAGGSHMRHLSTLSKPCLPSLTQCGSLWECREVFIPNLLSRLHPVTPGPTALGQSMPAQEPQGPWERQPPERVCTHARKHTEWPPALKETECCSLVSED